MSFSDCDFPEILWSARLPLCLMVDGGMVPDTMYAMRVAWSYMQRLLIMMSLVAENHGADNLSPGGGTFKKGRWSHKEAARTTIMNGTKVGGHDTQVLVCGLWKQCSLP